MIEARGLVKRYGSTAAVNDLSFTIRPGLVTGFLGPNGAGKTTTMRLILGLDNPSAGTVTVNGKLYAQLPDPMHQVGALLDAGAVHGGRTARNHLLGLAQTNGIGPRRVDEALGLVRNLMRSLAAEGRTVLVSSHLMSEMEYTADHLLVIGRGRLIADCAMAEFIARGSGQTVLVRTPQTDALARAVTAAGASVSAAPGPGPGELEICGLTEEQVSDLAFARGIRLYHLAATRVSLEHAFMELTADSVEYRAA